MGRVKSIKEKESAPKLEKAATKRLVKHALWSAAQKTGAYINNGKCPKMII